MATIRYEGLDEYMANLRKMASPQKIRAVCGRVIFTGAAIAADAMREELEKIPTVDHRKRGSANSKLEGITSLQKKGLLEGFGRSRLQRDDTSYNVKLGFNGKNGVKTKQYPDGQPNSIIARGVNSGTSFRARIPFVNNAMKKSKQKAEKAMAEKFDEECEKLIGMWG